MSKEHLNRLLKTHNLRLTDTRRMVLAVMVETGSKAVSKKDIEAACQDIDRITLYRTLKTFEDQGLIHQAMDASGVAKFALCKSGCDGHHHEDTHAHFYCERCESTVCLEDVIIPHINLPPAYALSESRLLLSGICNQCNVKEA